MSCCHPPYSRRAGIVGVHPVHAFGRDRQQQFQHAAELQLLLRFASEGYKAVLEATERLKGLIDEPKAKPPRKPAPARR